MARGERVTKEELDGEILAFVEKGIEYSNEELFNELAIKEFVHQYNENDYYQNLCKSQGIDPETVENWWDIPAVPTHAFRKAIIASFPLSETELSLLTSGTTNPDVRGKIYRDKGSLDIILKCNYALTKEFLFPDVERMRILLLVPSPKVAPGMPMAYGLEQAKKEFGTEKSDYYISPHGLATDELISALQESQATNEPVCLMGATSGFVFFFNQCRERGIKFSLPTGSRVCDGGGYQNTFGECTRDQYYSLVEEYLGIPWHMCVNTLGMGESGTNYFDNVLRDYRLGGQVSERYKVNLPWTRTVVVGIRTGKRLPKGELGLIRHYDLTNRATVLAVQTDNVGYETDNGFEIIGRAVNILGYGMQTADMSIKDWILGAGRYEKPLSAAGSNGERPEAHMTGMFGGHPGGPVMGHGNSCSTVADGMMKHGHPCSTVADAMIAHGHPCSTVADGMMGASGHQCSTVADGMIKHGNSCSTVADEMMQHGHPCSTVADAMMAHGHPCSTVADGMLQQGHPCSTVADGMLKHGHPCSTVADGMLKQVEKVTSE